MPRFPKAKLFVQVDTSFAQRLTRTRKGLPPTIRTEYHTVMKSEKRYPIPAYPPSIMETFTLLLESATPDMSVHHLEVELKRYRERLLNLKDRLGSHHFKTGLALYDRAMAILKPIDLCTREQRILVATAVEYVVREQDGIDDQRPVVGFEDDVKVMNHVLEELEMFSYFILPPEDGHV